jgi:hypothetical protein
VLYLKVYLVLNVTFQEIKIKIFFEQLAMPRLSWHGYFFFILRVLDQFYFTKTGVPSAESSRSVRGLGKGVSGNNSSMPEYDLFA